jgi:gamma-glutamylcyclotransferase (GGCT)/AIG2-like uncharacterized protein YtfP
VSGKDTVRVFVYGTLMEGYALHDTWMKDATKIKDHTILGYTLLNLGPYPALLKVVDPINKELVTSFAVRGEVWEMPKNRFAALAAMEMRVGYEVEELPGGELVFLFETIGNNSAKWMRNSSVDYQDQIPF